MDHLMGYIPRAHRPYARFLLSHVIRMQRWGVGRVVPKGWKLYLKGGWGSGSGRVDHRWRCSGADGIASHWRSSPSSIPITPMAGRPCAV